MSLMFCRMLQKETTSAAAGGGQGGDEEDGEEEDVDEEEDEEEEEEEESLGEEGRYNDRGEGAPLPSPSSLSSSKPAQVLR